MQRKKTTPKTPISKRTAQAIENTGSTTILLRAISTRWPDDATRPGLLLSAIPAGYYVAIHRYSGNGNYGNQRNVIHKAVAGTLGDAIRSVAKQFLAEREVYAQLKETMNL